MPISQKDFELVSRKPINWPGTGNDGKSLAQRLDERTQPTTGLTEARVKELIAEAVRSLPPVMTEVHAKELIAAAILEQHPLETEPPPEVEPPPDGGVPPPVEVVSAGELLLAEGADPFRLQETSADPILLTEST